MSWIAGMLLNGIICFALGSYLTFSKQIWLKVISFTLVPYFMAYILYWILAIVESSGSPSSEYSSWSGIIAMPWTVAGYLAFGVGFGLFTFIRAKCNAHS